MDWDKLRIFHTVAEAGSFTHAGETLGLSQSAVSRQISSLEESIGAPLFHRHARGLVLTEQGEILYKTSSDIFRQLSMIEAQLSDAKDQTRGPLLITSAGFIGSLWLAPRLNLFAQAHPDIDLTLLLDDRIFNLGVREADAAIRLYRPESQTLIQRQLATIDFGLYASKTYIEKHGKPETVADLSDHTIAGFPDYGTTPFDNPYWLLHLVRDHNLKRMPNLLHINSVTAIVMAVKNHVGIAAIPRFAADGDKTLVNVLPDLVPPSVDMYYVYPEERRHSKRIAIFRDFLLEFVENGALKPVT